MLFQEKKLKENLVLVVYLFVMFWDIHDNDESSNCSDEGKDDHKEVNNVMPRRTAEEKFGSYNSDSQNNLNFIFFVVVVFTSWHLPQ